MLDEYADKLTPPDGQPRRCLSCGRACNNAGRFCSARCRVWLDAGDPPYAELDLTKSYKTRAGEILPLGKFGFQIACAGCGKSFNSGGLRCCSSECEQHYREQQDNRAVMAAVGAEATAKRQCAGCGGTIPAWRNGRRIRKDVSFCCQTCAQRARRAVREADKGVQVGSCPPGGFDADHEQKCPFYGGLKASPIFLTPPEARPAVSHRETPHDPRAKQKPQRSSGRSSVGVMATVTRVHRDGWNGPQASPAIAFAWFCWSRDHQGPGDGRSHFVELEHGQ